MKPLRNVREPYASMTRTELVDAIDRFARNYNRLERANKRLKRELAIAEKRIADPDVCKHGVLRCIECEKRCEWCGDDSDMQERAGQHVCVNCAFSYDQELEEEKQACSEAG